MNARAKDSAEHANREQVMQLAMIDRRDVARTLAELVDQDDRFVVLHSSLVHLGCHPAEAKWPILAAIRSLIERGATFALPTFTFSFCEGGVFDPQASRSESGLLGAWLLELDGARRTTHPIYSFAAIGPGKDQLLDCANSTTFGPDSTFGLLHRANARIVMLGADWSYCTQFHHYEELAKVPYRCFKTFTGTVRGAGKTQATMFVRDRSVDARNDFAPAVTALRQSGKIRSRRIGAGTAESVAARDLGEACRALLADDPLALVADRAAVRRRLRSTSVKERERPLRVNLLGQRNMALLATALHEVAESYFEDRRVDVHAPEYGRSWSDVLDRSSRLHESEASATFFVDRLEDVIGTRRPSLQKSAEDAERKVSEYAQLVADYAARAKGILVVNRFARLRPSPLGQAGAREEHAQVASANRLLDEKLGGLDNVHLFDLGEAAASFAQGAAIDERLWHVGRFPFGRGFSCYLANRYVGLMLAAQGRTARLLVTDLDNTLWGGILGEDGIEGLEVGGDFPGNAHQELQMALKGLAERGLALAVASKNDEEHALEAMRRLDGMVLRQADFVSLKIGWGAKWQAVEATASELGLSLEHVAFIDDNPVEREQIRQQLPDVKVIDLPDDPALYARTLLECPYLECLTVTGEDRKRVKSYQSRARVEERRHSFANVEDFYASLDARMHVYPLDDRNLPRAVQLMRKTNQFNTTTRRYDGKALKALDQPEASEVFVVGLENRFSELENIGVAVMKYGTPEQHTAEIDSLLLSCRVLGQGVESALVRWLAQRAAQRGMKSLRGIVIPTERNTPVRAVFSDHGFKPAGEDGVWELAVAAGEASMPSWIRIVDHTRMREPVHG